MRWFLPLRTGCFVNATARNRADFGQNPKSAMDPRGLALERRHRPIRRTRPDGFAMRWPRKLAFVSGQCRDQGPEQRWIAVSPMIAPEPVR
jgi:hypothetical protein